MRNTLEYLATDPVTKRLMQEQRFAEMDVLSWKQTNKEQGRTIIRLQRNNATLQNNNAMLQSTLASQAQELDAYRRMYGNINTFPN